MGIDSLARYQAVLQAFHGFWPGIESQINTALPEPVRQEWAPRWRALRLSHDLQTLGLSLDDVKALPACTTWPVIDSPAAALGALYVVEGSSLGAKHISRHLGARLNLDAGSGAWFFAGHGDQTGPCWLRFKDLLQKQLVTDADQAAAVRSACDTFSCLNHWFQLSLPHG